MAKLPDPSVTVNVVNSDAEECSDEDESGSIQEPVHKKLKPGETTVQYLARWEKERAPAYAKQIRNKGGRRATRDKGM